MSEGTAVEGGGAHPSLPPQRPPMRPSYTAAESDQSAGQTRPLPPRPAPARPAPLPPGGRPPAPSSDGREGPPVKIPLRPKTEINSVTSRGSVRKRPEITVVNARPMNEIGFRDSKVTSADGQVKKVPLPPRPSRPGSTGDTEDKVSSRPPPPSPRLPLSAPQNTASLLDDDLDQSNLPPPMSLGMTEGDLLRVEPPSESPPTVPVYRPPPPPPRSAPDSHPPPPLSSPPPLPARNTVGIKPPTPPPRPGVPNEDRCPTPPMRSSSTERELGSFDHSSSVPKELTEEDATHPKSHSKRPTIIRPGRPLPSPKQESKVQDKPLPSPREATVSAFTKKFEHGHQNNATEPVYCRINKPSTDPKEEKGLGLPFNVKLKSTVPSTEEASEKTEEPPPVPPKQDTGPALPVKPRPTVLPKPKPGPKPKPSPDTENETSIFVESSSPTAESVEPAITKPGNKRPTIIRAPPKPKRVHEANSESSSIGKEQIDMSETRHPPVPVKRASTDSSPEQPSESTEVMSKPVSAKRPVSVAARFEQHLESQQQTIPQKPPPPRRSPAVTEIESSPSSSAEGETSPKSLKPPVPKARKRVSTPDGSLDQKATSPESSDSSERSPVPKRIPPPGKPPEIPPPRRTSSGDEDSPKSTPPPRPAGRPISAVAPRISSAEEDIPHKTKPPTPAGRPMSMIAMSHDSAMTDGEESSKSIPPRPAGRPVSMTAPKKALEGSSAEGSEDSSVSKPPRPSGPPLPRHSSDNDNDVAKRPPRPPGGPPRPTSMPARPPPAKAPVSKRPPQRPSQRHVAAKQMDVPPRPGPSHPLYHYILTTPHAIAKFDYEASQQDELSFKTDDVVFLIRRIDSEWLVGKVENQEGMFPSGFVDIIHPLHDEIPDFVMNQPELPSWDSPASLRKPTPTITSGSRCVARFDFDGEGKDDLTFEEDDVIRLIDRVGTEWLKGELNGKTGIFPLAFVEVVEDLPIDNVANRSSDGTVTAMFDFEGQDDELSFQAGQKIRLLGQVNTEWLYGEMEGRKGKLPSAFIDFIPPDLLQYEPPSQKTDTWSADSSDVSNQRTDPWSSDLTQEVRLASEKSVPHNRHSTGAVNSGRDSTDLSLPHCVANFDFQGEHDGDLHFQKGDIIQLLEKVGVDWMKGRVKGHEGMFPSAFVTVKMDLPDMSELGASGDLDVKMAKALYDFQGESEQELTFKTGDMITLESHVTGSSDWLHGRLNGESGIFPATFVEVVS